MEEIRTRAKFWGKTRNSKENERERDAARGRERETPASNVRRRRRGSGGGGSVPASGGRGCEECLSVCVCGGIRE